MDTKHVQRSYSSVCLECGYGWESTYDIDVTAEDHGQLIAGYHLDGRLMRSPLQSPRCPAGEGRKIRIMRPGPWLEALGWASLAVAGVSALAIAADMVLRGYRRRMWIMHLVYPITALYWGPVALWFYVRHGRRTSLPVIDEEGEPDPEKLPGGGTSAEAISHCGAGCVVGDIAGEWLVRASNLTIADKQLYADFLRDFAFAWLLGIGFQYFTIVPMRDIGPAPGLWAAVKADTFSIPGRPVRRHVGLPGGPSSHPDWPRPRPRTGSSCNSP